MRCHRMSERKHRESVASSVKGSDAPSFDLVSSVVERGSDHLSVEQAVVALGKFKEDAEITLSSAESVSIKDLHEILRDAIDFAIEGDDEPAPVAAASASSAAAGSRRGPIAYTATAQEADLVELNLPDVNIMEDERVWAVLDEGCNSSIHGSIWAKNAEQKLNRLGFRMDWSDEAQKVFKGLGSAVTQTLGRRSFPFCLVCTDPKGIPLTVPGILESHEAANSQAPLLLSQFAQASLNLVKHVRSGRCFIGENRE